MGLRNKTVKGLGLCSGGLDSILSALVLRRQGISVEWITFETPFFGADKARKASRLTGVRLSVQNITPVYMQMLRNPPCGYGKYMNPCMDCHALMFRLAAEKMAAAGFDFLFSGEVLGQRPMSQTKSSLRYVEKASGCMGYILRPLSARRLPETLVETEGLVNREQLLDISGRSRKLQMALAKEFGITDYPAPAGGCLLTDRGFSARLSDLFAHQETYSEADLELLKYGRHFRLDKEIKIIVGRTQKDNQQILKFAGDTDTLIKLKDYPGPLVLIPSGAEPDQVRQAIAICVGYSKVPAQAAADVWVIGPEGKKIVQGTGVSPEEVKAYLV